MGRIDRDTEHVAYTNQFGTLFDDEVAWPSGRRGRHLRLRMGDGRPGVVIVPIWHGSYGLVRSYRYAISAYQWGFPRGFAHGDDPLETARAELDEEMGLAGELRLCGWFTPDSGVQEMRVAVVLAQVASNQAAINDTDEVEETLWLEEKQLRERLGSDGWDDGMTMAALTLVHSKGCAETSS